MTAVVADLQLSVGPSSFRSCCRRRLRPAEAPAEKGVSSVKIDFSFDDNDGVPVSCASIIPPLSSPLPTPPLTLSLT